MIATTFAFKLKKESLDNDTDYDEELMKSCTIAKLFPIHLLNTKTEGLVDNPICHALFDQLFNDSAKGILNFDDDAYNKCARDSIKKFEYSKHMLLKHYFENILVDGDKVKKQANEMKLIGDTAEFLCFFDMMLRSHDLQIAMKNESDYQMLTFCSKKYAQEHPIFDIDENKPNLNVNQSTFDCSNILDDIERHLSPITLFYEFPRLEQTNCTLNKFMEIGIVHLAMKTLILVDAGTGEEQKLYQLSKLDDLFPKAIEGVRGCIEQ